MASQWHQQEHSRKIKPPPKEKPVPRHVYQIENKDKLRLHLEAGKSFVSFAGVMGISDKTLYRWTKAYPDFKAVRDEFVKPRSKLGLMELASRVDSSQEVL